KVRRSQPRSASTDRRLSRSRGRLRRVNLRAMTRLAMTLGMTAAALLLGAHASAKSTAPKQMEPRHVLKPPAGEGYFDDVFAIDAEGNRVAVTRTDGATFAKVEIYDAGTGKALSGFELPGKGQ